jgi:hypothetical protein
VEYYYSKAVLSALGGDRDASVRFWKKAYAIDPAVVRQKIKNRSVRQLLKRIGIQDARELLLQLDR